MIPILIPRNDKRSHSTSTSPSPRGLSTMSRKVNLCSVPTPPKSLYMVCELGPRGQSALPSIPGATLRVSIYRTVFFPSLTSIRGAIQDAHERTLSFASQHSAIKTAGEPCLPDACQIVGLASSIIYSLPSPRYSAEANVHAPHGPRTHTHQFKALGRSSVRII